MGSNLSFHECLGSGDIGEVFRATWKSKEYGTIEAAAKKIKSEGDLGQQVKREIDSLKKLNHRNIARYYDTLIKSPHVIILTEYGPKGSLYEYLKDKTKLPEDKLHRWLIHLATGMQYLHQMDIAHLDLKSPNCILAADDVLKICDFGINVDLTGSKTPHSDKGSGKWQAPEILRHRKLTPKADIFAFGVITWEMVTCEEPYKGMRPQARVICKVTIDGLRPDIPHDCPSFLKELMEQCWDDDLEKRPSSDGLVQRLRCEYEKDLTESEGLQWISKHRINSAGQLNFVAKDRLAICKGKSGVEVHQTTRHETHRLYTLTSNEWRGAVSPRAVAVSESIPDGILVICGYKPFVYQFPCRKSTQYVKKYQIHDGNVDPWCITANAHMVVVGLEQECEPFIVVCRLPEFTQEKIVSLDFDSCDLSITKDYLLVMGYWEMVIKPLDNLDHNLCRIQPPDGLVFRSVAFKNDSRQIYTGCYLRENMKGDVYKYIWDGNGTPQYVNVGCVIDNLCEVWFRGLSVSRDDLLAISYILHSKIFHLE